MLDCGCTYEDTTDIALYVCEKHRPVDADSLLGKILHAARNRLISVTNEEHEAILDEIEKYLKEKTN